MCAVGDWTSGCRELTLTDIHMLISTQTVTVPLSYVLFSTLSLVLQSSGLVVDQEVGERFHSVVYCKIQNSVLLVSYLAKKRSQIIYSAVPECCLASGCVRRSNGKFSLFQLLKNP